MGFLKAAAEILLQTIRESNIIPPFGKEFHLEIMIISIGDTVQHFLGRSTGECSCYLLGSHARQRI